MVWFVGGKRGGGCDSEASYVPCCTVILRLDENAVEGQRRWKRQQQICGAELLVGSIGGVVDGRFVDGGGFGKGG